MQLDLGLTTGTGPALVGSRDARLVRLAPFLLGTLRPAVARDAQTEREHRERRRLAQREDLAAQAAAQPTPADRAQQAEREQAPGSRAAQRQDTRAQFQEQALARRAAFRQALAGAAPRSAAPNESAPAPRATAAIPTAPRPVAATATAAEPVAVSAPSAAAPDARTAGGAAVASGSLPRVLPPSPSPRPSVAAIHPAASAAPAAIRGVGAAASTAAARPGGVERGPAASATLAPAPGPRAASRPKAPAAGATPIPDDEGNSDPNLTRIVRVIQAQLARERAVTTLRLDPPELGSLRLRLELQRDRLSVEMAAESPEARDLLRQHLDALRRNLEAAGLQLERVVVRTLDSPGGLPAGGPSAQGDAHTAWQEAAPRGEPEAGRSARTDAAAETAAEAAGAVGDGLATESLVNVWA